MKVSSLDCSERHAYFFLTFRWHFCVISIDQSELHLIQCLLFTSLAMFTFHYTTINFNWKVRRQIFNFFFQWKDVNIAFLLKFQFYATKTKRTSYVLCLLRGEEWQMRVETKGYLDDADEILFVHWSDLKVPSPNCFERHASFSLLFRWHFCVINTDQTELRLIQCLP